MRTATRRLKFAAGALLFLLLLPLQPSAQKFYNDDPLAKEPKPRAVTTVSSGKVSEASDFIQNSFSKLGERHTKDNLIRARGINTLDEVPDSSWYTNRHYKNSMTIDELVRGPERDGPPAKEGTWKVVAAKTEGVTPGFTIEDSRGRKYVLKFDPMSNPEMASAADVITSKFFYILGYNVPENYIVYFDRQRLVVAADAKVNSPITDRDIDEMLHRVPRDPRKGYRAMASRFISGEILGPFSYYSTREDDPNDIVPHEHRRELRGLFVFAAWLGHTDAKSLNTLDTVVEEDGTRYVKHYLVDFGSSLGSAAYGTKDARTGHEYFLEWGPGALQAVTLGLYVPDWARADYGGIRSVGRFEWEVFEPEEWKPNYPVPAFDNRLPDDAFWAAKQVMAFTDEQIRAIVKTGAFSDPEAEEWIAECLIERRNKIGKAYFAQLLPLDRFAVKDGLVVFENLAVKYGWNAAPNYVVQWSRFNNDTEGKSPLPHETTFALPRQLVEGSSDNYFAADIHAGDTTHTVTVYLRKRPNGVEVVGVERTWPTT